MGEKEPFYEIISTEIIIVYPFADHRHFCDHDVGIVDCRLSKNKKNE